MERFGKYNNMSSHGFYWLLVASRIAHDKTSFDYARSVISENGGLDYGWFKSPSAHAGGEFEQNGSENCQIPTFDDWPKLINTVEKNTKDELINVIIEGSCACMIGKKLENSLAYIAYNYP